MKAQINPKTRTQIVGALLIALLVISVSLNGQERPSLTLDQVRELLRIGTPDAAIAHEIEGRGAAFPLSQAILDELEREGAGEQTLEALRRLIPPTPKVSPSATDSAAEAWGSMAAASFSQSSWDQFHEDSRQALLHEQPITINMMEEHNHRGWSGESIEPVEITITSTALTVRWLRPSEGSKTITSPLLTIGTIEVTNKSVEGKVVGMVVRHLVPGTYLLHLDIQNGNRADDRKQLYLATVDAQIVKAQNGVNYLASPATSLKALEAVAGVIGMGVAESRLPH